MRKSGFSFAVLFLAVFLLWGLSGCDFFSEEEGEVVNNINELETALENEEVDLIALGSNINLENEIVEVQVNRQVKVDGGKEYKITGDGSIDLQTGDSMEITFSNMSFHPGDPESWIEDGPKIYFKAGEQGLVTFDNVKVEKSLDEPAGKSFFMTFGNLRVENSEINFAGTAFDMNRGGTGKIRENNFNETGQVFITNNQQKTELEIKDNDFTEIPAGLLFRTLFGDESITVNETASLEPIDDNFSEKDFIDTAWEIHQNLFGANNVDSENFNTVYADDEVGVFWYTGEDEEPQFP